MGIADLGRTNKRTLLIGLLLVVMATELTRGNEKCPTTFNIRIHALIP